MGRLLIVARLALRDLRHRPGQAVLLLAAITAATATLTLGLALGNVTSQHYAATKAATRGPDVVAPTMIDSPAAQQAALARIGAFTRAPGVTARSGPYPVTFTSLTVNGRAESASVMVEGRGQAPAAVDQPQVTAGTWIGPGEVVVERTFAGAEGIAVGDRIALDGKSFRVGGIAVTAAVPPEPSICYFFGCGRQLQPFGMANPGLVWLPEADARGLATPTEPLSYLVNLRLAPGAEVGAFAASCNDDDVNSPAPLISDWQCLQATDNGQVMTEQKALLTASWLLALLAVGSVIVLVGGRMAEQTRRAGLLKAAGGTPRLVASVLLAEHMAIGAAAAGLGLLAGHLAAPLVTGPGGTLLGAPVTPPVTAGMAVLAVVAALVIVGAATFVPAVRAAGTSTAAMLADAARAPSRSGALAGISSKLPVTLLVGLRLAARRPRRALLGAASVFVAVSGVAAALWAQASLDRYDSGPRANGPLEQVLLVVTVGLVLLAVVNAILIAWATVTDARLASAVTRVLGATPGQVSVGIAAAQALPALAGAVLGIPAGAALFGVLSGPGSVAPPAWWLAVVVLAAVAAVAVLTFIPSRLAGRGGPAPVLLTGG
jgi:putative ABC transport system permease protein